MPCLQAAQRFTNCRGLAAPIGRQAPNARFVLTDLDAHVWRANRLALRSGSGALCSHSSSSSAGGQRESGAEEESEEQASDADADAARPATNTMGRHAAECLVPLPFAPPNASWPWSRRLSVEVSQ